MGSAVFDEHVMVYDDLDVALDKLDALSVDGLTTNERHVLLERRERVLRRLPGLGHELINGLAAEASHQELGGRLSHALANWLRISRAEAARRIHEAEELAPRRSLLGEPLEPVLTATAAGQRDGEIGTEHVRVIREFFHHLPDAVDAVAREKAERRLAKYARKFRPDELGKLAVREALGLNPDGNFTDKDRARKRGVTLGPQEWDGTSRINGYLTPEARAGLEAVFATWAAPGMCNPDDQIPTVTGVPSEEAVRADTRSTAQRQHDALVAITRCVLMTGELGSHRGLPVTIIATATLEDLQHNTGVADTGGGTLLPIKDLIRMSAHAYHYLLLFDQAGKCELYKGRTTRLATPAQRLVLHATDRGCTHPGCDIPGYLCEVNHINQWANSGPTDIDNLDLKCAIHNRLHTTRKHHRPNTFHHPEKTLDGDDGEGP
jgi:hypothetical protein